MESAPTTVLLLPRHPSSLPEHVILAQAMQTDARYRPILVVLNAALEQQIATLGGGDLELLRWYTRKQASTPPPDAAAAAGAPDKPAQNPPRAAGGGSGHRLRTLAGAVRGSVLLRPLRGKGLFVPVSTVREFLRTIRTLRQHVQRVRTLFDQVQPAALLLAGDRHLGVEPAFLRVAGERGCFRLIVPFAYSSKEGVAGLRKDQPIYDVASPPQWLLKQVLRWCYPDQVYQSAYGTLFCYPPVTILALAALGMLSTNPWVMGAGLSDMMAVFGEEDYHRALQDGVPASKLVITGQPALDTLYQTARATPHLISRVGATYHLEPQRPRIICSVPQLAEHDWFDWPRHWEEVRFLVGALVATGAHVLLSLHPKSDPAQYRFLESEYGAHLLREPLREVLPVADLFVATYSSTVRWAVLLGIPTVVVDFYDFHFDIYDHLGGVLVVNKKPLLVRVLRSVLEDPPFYAYLQRQQHQAAQRMAPFDGQACQRILDLIATHKPR